MPRRKKRTFPLRPRKPSRVKRKTRKTTRGAAAPRRHPELLGLGLAVLGLFLASVVYMGWNGGYVGGALADGLRALLGAATYGVPVACLVIGLLMVGRSALVDVRPFRTGLAVLAAEASIAVQRGRRKALTDATEATPAVPAGAEGGAATRT